MKRASTDLKQAMRDPGLQEAIRAAGGVSELARHIGISQPSVSNWDRDPGRARALGRGSDRRRPRDPAARSVRRATPPGDIDEVDAARAQEYALLAALLARAPDARLLKRLAELRGDATPLGVAHVALARSAAASHMSSASSANTSISSSGSGAASCCPTAPIISPASCMSARWRGCAAILRALGIERAEGNVEPEDHAAILCEIMAGLAGGALPAPAGHRPHIFEKHLAPWIGRFFADLERAEAAEFLPPRRRARPRCSWKSRRRPSRCRREAARRRNQGGNGDETEGQGDGRPPRLPSRARRRRGRRGNAAGAARDRRQADTENNDEKRKARYKETDHVKTFYRVNRYPTN